MSSLEFFSYYHPYFRNYQIKHRLDLVTGRKQEDLDKVSKELIAYLKDGKEERLTPIFNRREIAHMRDVYGLYRNGRLIRNVSLVLILALLGHGCFTGELSYLLRNTARGFYLWWGALLLVALGMVLDFSALFTLFHLVLFTNDLWILNPSTDWMIQLLPEGFFFGIALRTGLLFIVLLLVTHLLLRWWGKEKEV